MIRAAISADIPPLLALGRAMHAESRFAPRPWNDTKVTGLMHWLIENEDGLLLVAERGGEMVGGFLGICNDHWCVDGRTACDLALYVSPDRRGGMAAAQLLRAYREWARSRGADEILLGITTGVNLETTSRLFNTVGFASIGNLFEYRGN